MPHTVRPRRGRTAIILVVTAIALGACGHAGGMGGIGAGMGAGEVREPSSADTGTGGSPATSGLSLVVEAGDLYFHPDTIRLAAGAPVEVTVTNVGQLPHDFTISQLEFSIVLPPGASVTRILDPGSPGEYRIVCTVAGHEQAGMMGTLLVTG